MNELVARLGPPSGTSSESGRQIWIWSTGDSLTGSALNCALRVHLDDSQRIAGADWQGNYGACRNLSQRLQGQY